MSAAVLVNDRLVTETTGKQPHSSWKPRSAEEMRRLQQLAEAALGFEQSRGDQVVLQNITFTSNAEVQTQPAIERFAATARDLMRTQPSLLRTAAMGLVILVLGAVFLRPLAKQTAALLTAPPTAQKSGMTLLAAESEGTLEMVPAMPAAASAPGQAQAVFDRVREQIRREPQSSTRLVESWLSAPAEEVEG